MICFPNAKINLGLRILNKRPDGFHELETIFYPVGIRDALEIVEASKMQMGFSGTSIPGEPIENLCLRAYEIISQDFDIPFVHIHLHKHIPIGAGLGGGSSDATFMIKLINDKFSLGMDSARLISYASRLGSDCAFFVSNSAAVATGRGEVLSPIDLDLSRYHIALVMPPIHVSTATAFKGIVPSMMTDRLQDLIQQPIDKWKDLIVNDFEKTVFQEYPQIESLKLDLYAAGAVYASMSGSGAAVYGIFRTKIELRELEKENKVFYSIQ